MTNDDKQTAAPFSAQENSLELDEQALEAVTGGGILSRFFGGSQKTTSPSSTSDGSVDHGTARYLNNMYQQAGSEYRYRPGGDGNFYLKK